MDASNPLPTQKMTNLRRALTLMLVVAPFLGLVAAACFWWGRGFTWTELGLFLGMYLATGFGVTVGYHRLFAHRAFETYRPIKLLLAVLGSMSIEGPLLKWAAIHRTHHRHSDLDEDPHSPHGSGEGLKGLLRGAWHSHIGWMFRGDPPHLYKYVKDLRADKLLTFVSKTFGFWVVLGLLIPTVIGALVSGSWMGALLGFIWGGLVRTFFVQHVTFSINSVCHLWGTRPFKSDDESRNNFVFGVLALGEGWHNNHHAFPNSARQGLRWWEIDVSYWLIRLMGLLGLAWRVRVPSREAMIAKAAS